MKRTGFLIILTAIFIIVSSLNISFVMAEEKTLVNLSSVTDLRVMFQFDKEKPSITFISPSGERIGEGNPRLKSSSGNIWCTYLIEGAEAGEWKIDYDKKSNETVTYSIMDSIENIAVQYFKLNGISDTTASVSFNADRSGGGNYDYEIYVIDGASDGTESPLTVARGRGNCGEDHSIDVNMGNVSTGTNYKLSLLVTMDGDTLFDQVYTDKFSYTNPNSPEALSGFEVHLDKRRQTITLDWSQIENRKGNTFLVTVSNAGGEEVYRNELNDMKTKVTYMPDDTELKISVYQKIGNLWSLPCEKNINLNPPYSISILSGEVAGSALGQIECKTDGPSKVFLRMAPDKTTPDEQSVVKEIEISKDEKIDFSLTDTYTYVFVSMLAPNGIHYEDSLDIYLDNTAPYITLYENYERLNVNTDSITIIGETNSGSVMQVNGAPVTLSENGEFSVTVNLVSGENTIKLTSADAAGNTTERTVVINRVANEHLDFSPKGFVSLFIGLGISVIISVLVLIFFKKRKEG